MQCHLNLGNMARIAKVPYLKSELQKMSFVGKQVGRKVEVEVEVEVVEVVEVFNVVEMATEMDAHSSGS